VKYFSKKLNFKYCASPKMKIIEKEEQLFGLKLIAA
jgi:DNA primase